MRSIEPEEVLAAAVALLGDSPLGIALDRMRDSAREDAMASALPASRETEVFDA